MPSFVSPLLRSPAPDLVLRHAGTGEIVATRIRTAFDSATRRQGLLGRTGLEPGEVLIIAPCNAVHTCFMRFPLDLAFVARDGRIVKVREHVVPWRAVIAWRAYAVVEAAAGTLGRLGVRPGEALVVSGPDELLFRGR